MVGVPGSRIYASVCQRILRLPNRSGLTLNFQCGKRLRDGADHLLTVPYSEDHIATCPARAVEQLIGPDNVPGKSSWSAYAHTLDRTGPKGICFQPCFPPQRSGRLASARVAAIAKPMSQILKCHTRKAGEYTQFSMHSFRSGGGVSRALAGDSTSTITQRTVSESPRTAARYTRLLEVVCPGTEDVRVEGISENQYREFKEFPLSELSSSWAVFANNPILEARV